MSDLSQQITDAANAPARVAIDGTSVEQQRLLDLIEADRHLAGKTAAARNHLGLRFVQMIPPAAG